MKIVVFSFYFKPDLCAGSFRCTALVEELSRLGVAVEVITTAPNRYASFNEKAGKYENIENVKIHRIALPKHNSGTFDQAKAFAHYYWQAKKIVKSQEYDAVFATSSRLFTAFLGARIAKQKKIPLYLDIRDIFLDTMNDLLSPKIKWLLVPVISFFERYTFKSANKINLVSQGFEAYFKRKYGSIKYSFFTNGIDKKFMELTSPPQKKLKDKDIVNILYAGNIGEGQGLHKIIPEFANQLKQKANIKIIGDGSKKKVLEDMIYKMDLKNVHFLSPMEQNSLINEYLDADVLFLHLNDHPAFLKVLPSKLFEYAAMGKPILAGLSGHSADFIHSELSDCAVFPSGSVDGALDKLKSLPLGLVSRAGFIQKFNREKIMREMALDILGCFDEND